jgi:hypothetical protein
LEAATGRIRFDPVILKQRHDGWTPARQFRFIEELAASRSITKACRAVGMSRDSAYTCAIAPTRLSSGSRGSRRSNPLSPWSADGLHAPSNA